MRHFFCILFLSGLLPISSVTAQPIPRAEADSLLGLLRAGKADTSRVKVCLRLGEYHLFKPGEKKADMDSAAGYAKEAEGLSRALRFRNGYDRSLQLLGQIYAEGKQSDGLRAVLQKSTSPRMRVELLHLLTKHYLYRPGEQHTDLDSAISYATEALLVGIRRKNASWQMESLIELGFIHLEKGDQGRGQAYLQEAAPLIEGIEDLEERAGVWYRVADRYGRSNAEMPAKLEAYGRSLALYRQSGNKEKEASTLKTIADMHQHQGKYAQAMGELLEVLRIYKSIGFRYLHYTYDLLAHVYWVTGNHAHALPYALAAVESAKATGDTLQLNYFSMRVGHIYRDLGLYQQALESYQKLLGKLQAQNAGFNVTGMYIFNINRSLLALNRPGQALAFLRQALRKSPPEGPDDESYAAFALGETYLALKEYPAAERHLLKALEVAKDGHYDFNWHLILLDVNVLLSKLYSQQGHYRMARHHLGQAFRLNAQRSPEALQLSRLHLLAFRLDSLEGNLSSAIAHYQRHKGLLDSLFNERKSNLLIAFQVQYDVQQKEQDLKLKARDIKLKEKNIALLREQNKAQQTQRNALVGGAALLLSLLGLGYNRYRLKQRNNQQLQAKQQEINHKNEYLSELILEKDSLLGQKDTLLAEKEQLLHDKDHLLTGQERLLEEKERLLKEIHHRVKNNLQVVMSLLNSQADSLHDKAALSAIQESQHRVQAMALIHQKLYQSEGVARINMLDYIEEVVAYLNDSYCLHHAVRFCLEVEPVGLDVTQAVPLGLIINEVITNAFKYAFPDGRPGTITLRLQRLAEATYGLTIADDGVGLPKNYDPAQSRSLGMTLLHGFSGQLGGNLVITSGPGLCISLVFAEEQLSPVYASVTQAG